MKIKVLLLALLVAAMAFSPKVTEAVDNQCTESCGGSGGGTTCAEQCPDGSWSGIGCLQGQTAHCTCSGFPVQANPYCS
jgi:hypothetical protein